MIVNTSALPHLRAALEDAIRRDENIDIRLDTAGGEGPDSLRFTPEQLPNAVAFLNHLIALNTAQGSFDAWEVGVKDGHQMYASAQDRGRRATDGSEAICGCYMDLTTGQAHQAELVGLQ